LVANCGGNCGDGVAQTGFGEQCDGDDFQFDQNGDGVPENSCNAFGFYEGVLACDTDCVTPVLTGCSQFCGDGIRQDAHGEICDGDDFGGVTCAQLGFAGGTLSCNSSCSLVTTGCDSWLRVTAGVAHTCARSTAGAVFCWGDNEFGQLGDGTTTDRTRPVAVSGLGSGVSFWVSAGAHHTCAIQGGNLVCWGRNTSGQLGNGGTANSPLPVAVSGMQTADVQMVSAGAHHTCALKGGNPFCWGGNTYGQLGTGNTSPSLVPAAVTGLTGLREIVAGGEFTCGIVEAISTVRCWGRNDSGQVGDATFTPVIASPQVVAGLTNDYASYVFLGATHACLTSVNAMNGLKQFHCWGSNALGQVGNNETADANWAQLIWSDSTSYSPFAGSSSNVTIVSRPFGVFPGTYAWGDNQAEQILAGGAPYYSTPQQRSDFSTYYSFGLGAAHVCVPHSGKILCWGHNDQGQLGDGTTTAATAAAPVQVQGP
jgi:alpha-tubulin suppressor-like RCC1 family protein